VTTEGAVPSIGLVALDVDGTVLQPDGRIAPSTVAAVAAARARSVRVVLASSRGPVALARIQDRLGLRDEWFIGYQGALVARWAGDDLEILAETTVDHADAEEVESRALAAGLSIGRYVGFRWRVPRLTAPIRHEAAQTGERPLLSTAAESEADAAPHKLAAMAAGDREAPALRRLAESLPRTVTATFSHPHFLEITAAGVDKASGLGPLLDHLRIAPARTAAVGDGRNDLGLFAAVAHAVAMGQAEAAVQAAAGWVTGSNTEDGVARALAHLGVVPGPVPATPAASGSTSER
jgi:Cof subfamily protein (haloacid dehalogenase superfamily)